MKGTISTQRMNGKEKNRILSRLMQAAKPESVPLSRWRVEKDRTRTRETTNVMTPGTMYPPPSRYVRPTKVP